VPTLVFDLESVQVAESCPDGTLKKPFAVVVVSWDTARWVQRRRRLVGDDDYRFGWISDG